MASRASAESEKREEGKLLQPVGVRAASGESWQLENTEKDFEYHKDALQEITTPYSIAASYKIMNALTQSLQRERPPRKHS